MNGVIIGAGISGLGLAVALHKRNVSIKIYEAAKTLTPTGAGIILPPNAVQILSRYNLEQPLREKGNSIKSFVILDSKENIISKVPAMYQSGKVVNQTIAIHRSDIHETLLNLLPPDLIHTNKRILNVNKKNDYFDLEFQDGSQFDCDFIIGADGLNSVIRTIVSPDSKLRYSGQTCWRGISNATIPQKMQSQFTEIWGPGSIFGFVAINKTQIYWFATQNSQIGYQYERELIKENLIKYYKNYHPLIEGIIKQSASSSIIQNDLFDIEPLKKWYKGPIALIGDAAHAQMPNLGQGGAQAIEDSWVLAKSITQSISNNLNIINAFKDYEKKRIARANKIMDNSKKLAKVAHISNKFLCVFRNIILKNIPRFITKIQSTSLYKIDE